MTRLSPAQLAEGLRLYSSSNPGGDGDAVGAWYDWCDEHGRAALEELAEARTLGNAPDSRCRFGCTCERHFQPTPLDAEPLRAALARLLWRAQADGAECSCDDGDPRPTDLCEAVRALGLGEHWRLGILDGERNVARRG